MKRKQEDREFTLFFQNFAGMSCKFITSVAVPVDEQESSLAAVTGILLDEDEMFYYLGNESNEVNQAIAKTSVMMVYCMDSVELAMSKVPAPDTSEFN